MIISEHRPFEESLFFNVDILYLLFKYQLEGIPGWLSGLAPAFSPGCDLGVQGSSPTSGSMQSGESASLSLSAPPPTHALK